MKKDNRIVRPEQLNEQSAEWLRKGLEYSIEKDIERDRRRAAKREEIKRQMIENGEIEERDGKLFIVGDDYTILDKLNNISLYPLQDIRKEKCLTQKQLAEKSGVNLRTIQNYECGRTNLEDASISTGIALAKALDCKVEDLI